MLVKDVLQNRLKKLSRVSNSTLDQLSLLLHFRMARSEGAGHVLSSVGVVHIDGNGVGADHARSGVHDAVRTLLTSGQI